MESEIEDGVVDVQKQQSLLSKDKIHDDDSCGKSNCVIEPSEGMQEGSFEDEAQTRKSHGKALSKTKVKSLKVSKITTQGNESEESFSDESMQVVKTKNPSGEKEDDCESATEVGVSESESTLDEEEVEYEQEDEEIDEEECEEEEGEVEEVEEEEECEEEEIEEEEEEEEEDEEETEVENDKSQVMTDSDHKEGDSFHISETEETAEVGINDTIEDSESPLRDETQNVLRESDPEDTEMGRLMITDDDDEEKDLAIRNQESISEREIEDNGPEGKEDSERADHEKTVKLDKDIPKPQALVLRRSARVKLKKQRSSFVKDKKRKSKRRETTDSSSKIENSEKKLLKESSSSSPLKRPYSEDSEADESNQEDFPTEGLLKELHFLNTSCEKPSFSKSLLPQNQKTPKKQQRLDGKGEDLYSATSTERRSRRKAPPKKRPKIEIEKNPNDRNEDEESDCDEPTEYSSDEGGLHIDEDEYGKRKAQSQNRMKKKMRPVDSGEVPLEVIELIKSGIDEALEEKAERTHLTAIHVKNIIKNVMTDENVLAMVRNTVLGLNTTEANSSTVYEPTLTRAKTKEIIQQQAEGCGKGSIWAELSKSATTSVATINPETRALVTADFPDEDEDEEYTPEADGHVHSDDESCISTHFGSTLGSPTVPITPSTPLASCTPKSNLSAMTPSVVGDVESPAQPVEKRIQLLKQNSAQRMLNFEQPMEPEGLVSQRTRSKLPLKETPLECLEMAFKPPDVTDDMYESEVLDDDWKTFLIDFIHPLGNAEGVEDEEADPEYNVLEDKEDDCDLKEDLRGDRAVQIPRKEINALLTELLGTLDSDEEGTEPVRKHLSQHITSTSPKRKAIKNIEEPPQDRGQYEGMGPPPNVIWVEVLTAKFTPCQYDILRQQMAKHTQLLTTTVILCDGLPSTTVADSAMQMLEELKSVGVVSDYTNTFFHASNLDAALSTLKVFKDGPSTERKKRSRTAITELSPRVIDTIMESTAFPFPDLLPTRMLKEYKSNKVPYVPAEEKLIAMVIDSHLSSLDEARKREKLEGHLPSVLQESLKDSVIKKSATQLQRRIKTIRSHLKDHLANENPLALYLSTCKLESPNAVVESLLPCIPCPVKDLPTSVLKEPWLKIISSRREKEFQAASKLQRKWTKELLFGGMQPLRAIAPRMVILQSEGISTQVLLPTTLAPIAPAPPSSTLSVMASTVAHPMPNITVLSPAITSVPTLPETNPSITSTFPTMSTVNSTSIANVIEKFSLDVASNAGNSQPSITKSLSSENNSSIVKKLNFEAPPIGGCLVNNCDTRNDSNDVGKTFDISSEANQQQEPRSSVIGSVCDPVLEKLGGGTDNCPEEDGTLEECLDTSLETPRKSPPIALFNVPTPNLHMPSLLSTPGNVTPVEKRNLSPVMNNSLDSPNSPHNPMEHKSSSPSPPPTPAVESDGADLQDHCPKSPAKSISKDDPKVTECIVASSSESRINQNLPAISENQTEPAKEAHSLFEFPVLPHGSNTTLVTSVYQSPISSSGVGGMENIRLIMNLSPQKSSYRKVSPRKILRSPIKTSPMKKVSPILKKYRYQKNKRPANKKLSPILPKMTKSPKQRSLRPKIVKEEPPKPVPQNISVPKVGHTNPVTQGHEEAVMENTSRDPSHLRTENAQHSEEEFEEEDLEEEEEEEEEDSEAAQQREEHLAALLKASSTIVGKKGDKLSGGDIGERRLNKQQKRLQARINALSIVQDSVEKDQSMAQSYLMRVREALTGKDPMLYKKFLSILNAFTENSSNTPVELYENLCEILREFPLLSEEFVAFLLPQQAIAIGKYAQYCAIHRMRDFLDKLKFRKQPQHIQKIIRLLQSLHNAPNLDFEKVKAAICPLLKYPHLVESFTFCFASQPPPPSLSDDFEEISLERSNTPDSVENIVLPDGDPITSPDSCGCSCHVSGSSPPTYIPSGTNSNSARNEHCQSCALRFSEGKVYLQYGKTLRPAKVTYHCEGE